MRIIKESEYKEAMEIVVAYQEQEQRRQKIKESIAKAEEYCKEFDNVVYYDELELKFKWATIIPKQFRWSENKQAVVADCLSPENNYVWSVPIYWPFLNKSTTFIINKEDADKVTEKYNNSKKESETKGEKYEWP